MARDTATGQTGYVPRNYLDGTPEISGHCFGLPLVLLAARERQLVPAVVAALVGRLRDLDGQHKKGLFRFSGNHARMTGAMAEIDRGAEPAAALAASDCDALDCATLLGRWLRQLPTRLLEFGLTVPELDKPTMAALGKVCGRRCNMLSEIMCTPATCGSFPLASRMCC